METIYLDNAASTATDPVVVEAMLPYLTTHFGNPSSTHAQGRVLKVAIESARKSIANHINAQAGEIIFTSGGTEADNIAIFSSHRHLGIRTIITSRLEHHAVLHPIEYLHNSNQVEVKYVKHNHIGKIDLEDLQHLLSESEAPCFVSIMHANNEIGTLQDLKAIGNVCRQHKAYFHSDTVQTLGHLPINVKELPIDFITASAHKFHGPKGVGFLWRKKDLIIPPQIFGGGQERGMRSGTENVAGIVGMAKALEIADYDKDANYIRLLKQKMMDGLKQIHPEIVFNGASGNFDESLYTVLNVRFPLSSNSAMLLFKLELAGISVSGGSACSSGAFTGSHVLSGISVPEDSMSVRFSFSKMNTEQEIDKALEHVKRLLV